MGAAPPPLPAAGAAVAALVSAASAAGAGFLAVVVVRLTTGFRAAVFFAGVVPVDVVPSAAGVCGFSFEAAVVFLLAFDCASNSTSDLLPDDDWLVCADALATTMAASITAIV